MPKKFIDSDIWGDSWFMDLKPIFKLVYIYVFSNCDNTGLYKVNLKKMQFEIGEKVDVEKLTLSLEEKIKFYDSTWLIMNYIRFQYPNILKKPDSPLHKSVLDMIDRNCLKLDGNSLYIDYAYPMHSLQEKKREERVKEEVKEKVKSSSVLDSDAEKVYQVYPRKIGHAAAMEKIKIALRAVEFEDLILKVSAYAESVKDKDPQFIPMPSTWFHQQRYNDPIETNNFKPPSSRMEKLNGQYEEQIEIPRMVL